MRPLRILALVEATTVTGPAKNLIEFCKTIRYAPDVNISVSVAAFHRTTAGDPSSNGFINALREAHIEFDVILERRSFDFAVIGLLREIVARRAPDVIQTHASKSHFLARWSGIHLGRRWIAFHHGYTAENLKMRLFTELDRWSLQTPDRVITVCQSFGASLLGRGVRRERIQVIPNGIGSRSRVPNEEISALRIQMGVPWTARVILCVGRLSPEKGHRDLLLATAQLLREHPNLSFRLILVGDGPERHRLEHVAAALSLRNVAIFVGHCSNVLPFYFLADVFALASYSEGSPNVLLEAMAAGVPIVATSVGGIPEMLEHEYNGLLVPSGTPSVMAGAMARMLEDDSFRVRVVANAFERVERDFSVVSRSRALVQAYKAVCCTSSHVLFR